MDIEWAKDGNTGELFIVQARPETVQSRKQVDVIEVFKLKERAAVLAKGRSIGEKVASGVVRVVIKGLTRGEFRRLLTAHPPRDGDDLDGRLGYNADTFGDALVSESILRTENLDGETVPAVRIPLSDAGIRSDLGAEH